MSFGISIFLAEPKINEMDNMRFFSKTHQKVFRFDVAMNIVF